MFLLEQINKDFNKVIQNGMTFEVAAYDVVLDPSMNNLIELNQFAVDLIERKNILIENVLLYLKNSNEFLPLGWSGIEHIGGESNKFVIYIKEEKLYKHIENGLFCLILGDCFIDFSQLPIELFLKTSTVSEYNFVNDNQDRLVYELPALKRYVFDKETFQLNYNDLKALNFHVTIKCQDYYFLKDIPIKLAPGMNITILPPDRIAENVKHRFSNKILDHDNDDTIYFSKDIAKEVNAKRELRSIKLTYAQNTYNLTDRVKIEGCDLLKAQEICVNFMYCLSENLEVAGSAGDEFVLEIAEYENGSHETVLNDSSLAPDCYYHHIYNPPIDISLPTLTAGINIMLHPNNKYMEISRLRFLFLMSNKKCIFFDTVLLSNLLGEGKLSKESILAKYVFGKELSTPKGGTTENVGSGESLFTLVESLYQQLNRRNNDVVLIACCDLFFQNDNDDDAEADAGIDHLKWRKLFRNMDSSFSLILQFENEQSIPSFFKSLHLFHSPSFRLQISYKENTSDYRDCLNLAKLSSDVGYVSLAEREKMDQKLSRETEKPIYGLSKAIEAMKTIYQTPMLYGRLYNQFPKLNKHMLLYSGPSMGKTLLMKHAERELNLGSRVTWRHINSLALISKYTGESERNVRKLFADARSDLEKNSQMISSVGNNWRDNGSSEDRSLCFIVIDNIHTLLPSRSSSNGISDRLVNTFLTELDGVDSASLNEGIVVIGVSNRPDLLDPALVRPGRLENKVKIDHSSIDWNEVIRRGGEDYLGFDLAKEMVEDIKELIFSRKVSVGAFLGALYEVKLAGEPEIAVFSEMQSRLKDENESFNEFERCFRKFDGTEEDRLLAGEEMAFI